MPADGCEVDLARSTDHCGSCGRSCLTANVATAECSAGACRVLTCDAGFADCDGNPANGCEVDTRVSTAHCGRCGNACAAPGGTAVCRASVCGVGACATGRGDCDGDARQRLRDRHRHLHHALRRVRGRVRSLERDGGLRGERVHGRDV